MHEVCCAACHHERMLAEIRYLRRQAERFFRLALTEGMNVLEDIDKQCTSCAACGSGDADNAEPVALALLDWTVERVAPILATSGTMTPVR